MTASSNSSLIWLLNNFYHGIDLFFFFKKIFPYLLCDSLSNFFKYLPLAYFSNLLLLVFLQLQLNYIPLSSLIYFKYNINWILIFCICIVFSGAWSTIKIFCFPIDSIYWKVTSDDSNEIVH